MRAPSCVIIVENLPVPFDRRVWQEACALRDTGWTVSVICPLTDKYPETFEMIDNIAVYRHPLPEARGKAAFALEYGTALFHEFRLLMRVARERGFDVIQVCNPPDLLFLPALPFKFFGSKFIFDHHDISPELFAVKFGQKGLLHRALKKFERWTFQTADLVISTNETFREIAIERGGKDPDHVVTVYSVPDVSRIRRVAPDKSLSAGKNIVLGYVGIINDQDGVDHVVRAVHHLVHDFGIRDVHTVIVGDGPALPSVRALADELGIADEITFTGYLSGENLLAALSAFDIGIIPDPPNEYNDKISMNKVFEYSALGIPIVAYNLTETKRLLRGALAPSQNDEPSGLAAALHELIVDEKKRQALGRASAAVARGNFSWDNEAAKLVEAYERLLPRLQLAEV